MKIFIFRHAQKNMDFSGDPGLSAEGHAQAQKLSQKVSLEKLPKPDALWVSPRKRAQSTFRPLAEDFQIEMKIVPELLEQQPHENLTSFRQRLQQLLNSAMEQENEVLFMCSHYDVTVEFMSLIHSDKDLSQFSHWNSCQYIGFEVKPDEFKFLCFERIQA